MKFIRHFCISFLILFLGLFTGIQASENTPESLDLSKYQIINASKNTLLITEEGMFMIDSESNEVLHVDGFIKIENEFYAIQMIQIDHPNMEAVCGHRYGCMKCFGCIKPGCWNHCPGCKK